jgi:hypothetical protein
MLYANLGVTYFLVSAVLDLRGSAVLEYVRPSFALAHAFLPHALPLDQLAVGLPAVAVLCVCSSTSDLERQSAMKMENRTCGLHIVLKWIGIRVLAGYSPTAFSKDRIVLATTWDNIEGLGIRAW